MKWLYVIGYAVFFSISGAVQLDIEVDLSPGLQGFPTLISTVAVQVYISTSGQGFF